MMIRATVCLLFGAAVLGLMTPEAQAQPYLPGPVATIAQFTSSTALGPAPRVRTTIGIGEQVSLAVNPATWADTDIDNSNPEAPKNVPDTMGTVTWAISGPGELSTKKGNTTTLTAYLTPGTITVTATILDSQTEGLDPAIQQSMAFSVIAPSGSLAFDQADSTADWVLGPPNNRTGQSTKFQTQVTPITVNFSRVSFQENIPAQNLGNWPDGTLNTYDAETFPYSVSTAPGGQFNWTGDTSAIRVPAGRLKPPMGPPPAFYNYTVSVPNQYKNAGGNWVTCFTDSKQKSFNTTNLQARGAYTCDTTLWGNWMGPWQ